MTDFRVGLAGAGGIARRVHAPNWEAVGGVVAALYDISDAAMTETADVVEGLFGTRPATYTDYEKFLAHPTLDVVDVCSSNNAHAPLATGAIMAGKHVCVEKPFANTLEAAQQACDAWHNAASDQIGLGVLNNTETKWYRTMRALLKQGEIGELTRVDGGWIREQGVPLPGSGFTRKDISGGGALIDLGPHIAGLILGVVGPEAEIREVGAHAVMPGDLDPSFPTTGVYGGGAVIGDGYCDVDLAVNANMSFALGERIVPVHMEVSWVDPEARQEMMWFTVSGSNGSMTYHRVWHTPDDDKTATWSLAQHQSRVVNGIPWVNEVIWNRNHSPMVEDMAMGREVMMQVMAKLLAGETIESLRDQGYAANTLDELLEVQALIELIYRSIAERKTITEL